MSTGAQELFKGNYDRGRVKLCTVGVRLGLFFMSTSSISLGDKQRVG